MWVKTEVDNKDTRKWRGKKGGKKARKVEWEEKGKGWCSEIMGRKNEKGTVTGGRKKRGNRGRE